MMNGDLLLEWMTHIGSGAWGSFRKAVAELSAEDVDEQLAVRTLRIALSDLGHVDFFVDGSMRWRVRRPALVGLAARAEHLFVGGRTRSLMGRLCDSLAVHATVTVSECIPGLSRVHVVGDPGAVAATASDLGIQYLTDASAKLLASLPSAHSVLEASARGQEPINWAVRSWSFREEAWVSEKLERTVREYRNRHGVRRYMVHAGRAGLCLVEKRASLYCAAFVRGSRVAHYDNAGRSLLVPRWAPLPEGHARAACLAGGQLGELSGEHIVFANVDPRNASMLLVSLGQGFPMPESMR